jgi:predicted ArsR family transcriptional regulator
VRTVVTIVHEIWRQRGLGKIAARIWELLENVSVEEMPAKLGVRPRTVRRHLVRMERFGLVRRLGKRWVRVDDADVQARAARALRVVGEGERQRERHQAERWAFHARREGLIR